MKTIIKLTLAAALAAGTLEAFAQDDVLARLRAQRAQEEQQLGGQQPAETTPSPSADNGTVGAGGDNAATTVPPAATQMEPATAAPYETADDSSAGPEASFTNDVGTNGITMNFRNAPLSKVLSYMSDAAGFIVVLDTPVSGYVNVISAHPMTQDEAVDLLNTVLNQNGLAAVRDGRTLTIMTKAQAIHDNIPVIVGNDPANIPKNDEIVTQIIPIRFVDSQQLVADLSPFVSSQATIVANQEGNSIIITDTQSNIRHLVKIIESIDSSAETETKVEVFPLKYANPNDIVTMLQGVFPNSTSGTQSPISFGGRGGGRGGNPFARFFGAAGNSSASGSEARIQKAQQVVAVADGRTQSVVVTAAKDMMPEIEKMIDKLDVKSDRDTKVYTVHLDNADPSSVLAALQSAFPSSSTSRSSGSTTQSLLQQRPTQMNNSSSSGTSTSGFGTTSGSSRGGLRGGG
ncbi:MAG TPA: secretin N-terminal domain-containing protein [Candidatus Paceibacterota bacterium]|nr:secretin N-terminal domain-containing protein [Candidatus Paceibacterota bacterium]